ncbi:alpha/beta fold hydrolase [Microbulbifer guangxiensis]|uniref:alpha/beta fold hydrolase n=1 Tax=Microbulbifer guangxiensis TaxID=2904249 RepID=UPI001F380DA1|nr:alpha/beta fold hydrolase [Microbulbifer guangxiensis]
MSYRSLTVRAVGIIGFLGSWLLATAGYAACTDNIVLVHGNSGSPSDWDNTVQELKSQGFSTGQIYLPNWGSKSCAACNDHNGSEETPVRNAIQSAIAASCTGKIDVIGHSMGVTLAAQQIVKAGVKDKVDAFVGIAGAYRGLWSCGTYPFNVYNSTCGYYGLSVSSPFLDWLYGKTIASRVYSIKSWSDQIVCTTGVCTVGGVHSSQIAGERASYTYPYGHFGLQSYTYDRQVSLIQ